MEAMYFDTPKLKRFFASSMAVQSHGLPIHHARTSVRWEFIRVRVCPNSQVPTDVRYTEKARLGIRRKVYLLCRTVHRCLIRKFSSTVESLSRNINSDRPSRSIRSTPSTSTDSLQISRLELHLIFSFTRSNHSQEFVIIEFPANARSCL